MQRMALDPLAAVQEPPQLPDLRRDVDRKRVFHRVHRAHLVSDRADSANASGDVGRFFQLSPAEQRLEISRRLVDSELKFLDFAVEYTYGQRAFPFYARDRADFDRAGL